MKGINQVLKEMRKGAVFSLKFCSFDVGRKKGGEIVHHPEAKLIYSPKGSNANHKQNGTINIELFNDGLATGLIRTVHIILITRFNNQKITL